jgi:hypothetical protein
LRTLAKNASSASRTADSRFTRVSYFAPTGCARERQCASSGVIAPMRQRGGAIIVRSTGIGTPFSWSVETSASPTASCEIACATSSFGFGANVSAAVLTAFWSRGVYARSACWMRLPSWPRISPARRRELRAEVHADALRADEPHDLLDALAQRGRRVVEQQVRLVEEEHELGLVEIATSEGSRTARRAATAGSSSRAAASASAGRRRGC